MSRLARMLKSSQFLYSLYFYSMSFFIRLLGLVVGWNNKLILFNCFGGKRYDDSPRAIYEEMVNDHRFDDYKLVWALQKTKDVVIPGRATVVKSDSLMYFIIALRAKMWVTNSSMERGLDFKKKRTICLNTWHGTPIKVMGIDVKDDSQSFKSKLLVRADIMLAQGQYDIDVFSRCFQIPLSSFRLTGLPRNDHLANYTPEQSARIKEQLGIQENKTVILYAPTFREYVRSESNEVILDVPMDLSKWQQRLGDEYVVLFRAHYEVAKHMKIDGSSMFIDVSSYPSLEDLMIISDALITDYSSIIFDYSVMHKPIYCFAYDYEEYMSQRGMYIDLKEALPCVVHINEDTLIDELLRFSDEKEDLCKRTISFQEKYVSQYGQASQNACNEIIMLIK